MEVQKLKTVKPFFQQVWDREKTFEVRFNDRDFHVGQLVELHEYLLAPGVAGQYTGRVIFGKISYVLSHEDFPQGLKSGYVVLGMVDLVSQEPSPN